MKVKIALSENKIVWALNHPSAGGFIRPEPGIGDQEITLILSQADPGPKEVDLDKLPKWAQNVIISSIKSGEITNLGSPTEEESEVAGKRTKAKAKKAKARKKK